MATFSNIEREKSQQISQIVHYIGPPPFPCNVTYKTIVTAHNELHFSTSCDTSTN